MKPTTSIPLVSSSSSTASASVTVSVQPCTIVAADHPSLDRDVDAFLVRLTTEGPFVPTLVRALSQRGGFRLAAIECGHVVGLVRVDPRGELHIAVAAEHRGLGIGTRLGTAALERAINLEYSRVVMRTTGRRNRRRAVRRASEAMGCIVIENASGRTDMTAHLPTGLRSA